VSIDYYHKAIAGEKPDVDIVRVGIHNILIHLQVYKGASKKPIRLYDVAADSSKNRAKLLETAIELSMDSFSTIQASIFPLIR